jgi:DNA-binding response OmpR family regulator
MPRILVVEDQADLAEVLQRNLEDEGHHARVAGTAAEAIAATEREPMDLLILDIGLPDRDGFAVLDAVRARGDATPVLILSARGLQADKLRGFRAGADDYVTKPFGVLELLARVAALLRRAGLVASPAPPAPSPAGAALTDDALRARFGLTDREVEVTRLLALGVTNAELAERIAVSPKTARNHTDRVLRKLGVGTRARIGALLRGEA